MTWKYLGATAALAAGANQRPPREANLSSTFLKELHRKLALVLAVATLQQASGASVIRGPQVKQAESTVDQLCNRPLEGIPTHRNHAIIVLVFTRNAQTQREMGLPPVTLLRNPLIIEQSWETGTFGKISVARHKVEAMINTPTSVMTSDTRTAANSPQDIMIKSAETS